MQAGNVLTIALHDLRLTVTDRGAALWMLLLPIVFATFFGIVTGGDASSAHPVASLTVVDRDRSPVSRLVIEELEGEGVQITELSFEERGSTDNAPARTLVIPPGFGEGVLAGNQQTLRLEQEPDASQEASLVAQARILAATVRVVGRLIEASASVDPDAPIPVESFTAVAIPEDVVLVETKAAGRATVVPDGFAQSIPGMAVMFVMLVALTYGAASVSGERAGGNLRRLATAPVSRAEIIAGKIVGRFIIAAVQITLFVTVGVIANRAFGIFIGDHPVQIWLALLCFAAAVAPLGVAVGGWVSDPDRAASIGVILTMVMAALGGCWWPLEVVSGTLQKAALIFPTGWAMRTLHGLISFGQNLAELRGNMIALGGFAVVFGMLAVKSLRIE
jgi:ABC-type multidrug transport system permease subunit